MSGSNVHCPPTTLDPSFDILCTIFHEEPYALSPLEGPYGYFPMRLGQKLRQGKYEIVRKLGYGTNSSVWLAKETMCVPPHSRRPGTDCRLASPRPDGHRYIVLKIMSVYATNVEIRKLCHEAAVARSMTTFGKSDQTHPGYRYCAMIGRTFFEHSAHGEHLCSLLVPYGTSLEDILETSPTGRLPLSAVKTITRQVLLGLSFLEDKLQRVHAGQSSSSVARHVHHSHTPADIKSENILHHPRASTEQIDRFLADNPPQMYVDTPPIDPRISPDPIPAVRSQPLPNFGLNPSYANISVKIIDYDSGMHNLFSTFRDS